MNSNISQFQTGTNNNHNSQRRSRPNPSPTSVSNIMKQQKQQHPVATCMASIISTLSKLPVPPHQSKDLAPVFNVHNAIRQSSQCIAKHLSTFHIDMNVTIIRYAAKGCYEWLNWYMPHLHQHHHAEDDYWFPVWRKVLIDAGVEAADVNAVFDRWEADHESLDQYEREMTNDLQVLSDIRDDITRDELQEALVSAQRSTRAFASFIHNHLKSEEEYWVDQFITHDRITQQHAEQLHATFIKNKISKMKLKDAGDAMGFIFTTLEKQQEQQVLKNMLPFPVRCYYNWFARPSYLKRAPKLYLIAHGHLAA